MKRKMETSNEKLRQNVNEDKVKEKDYQSIIRTTTDGFWIVDSKGRFLDVNDAYCALVGYSRKELLNMSIPDIEAVEKPEDIARRIRRIIKTGHDRFETRHRCKDGRMVDIEISTTYAGAGDGRLFVFARDITERKQMEETLQAEKNKLQAIIDAMEHGLTIIDRDYNILYQSEPSRMTGGYHLGEKCYRAFEGRDNLCDGCPVEKAFKDGKSHNSERRIVTLSGEVIFLENTANPIRDAGGRIVSCLEITRNVTERKQIEEALRESEEKYKTLFESTIDGLCVIDAQTMKILLVNEATARLYGFDSPEEAVGRNIIDFVMPEERQMAIGVVAEDMFQKDLHEVHEWRTIAKDGKEIWVSAIGTRMQFQGRLAGLISFRDITKRKQAEEALRQSQEKLRQMFESVSDGISVIDLNGVITEVNQRTVELHGFASRDELLGKGAFELVAPCDREKVATNMRKALKRGAIRGVEYTLLKADGTEFPGELSTSVLKDASGKWVGHITIVRDISERKKAAEALQAEKNKLQSVIDAIEYNLTIVDTDYNILYQSGLFKEMSGDHTGEKCYRVYEGRDEVCNGCPVEKALRDGKSHTWEMRKETPSGEITFGEHTASPIRDAEGRITSCLEITRDITERKRMEEALRESEERFRSIVESSHAGIMILDDAYHFIYANDELCQMSGYSREEIIGQDFRQFLDEESRQLVADRYLRRQGGEELPPRYEFNFVRKDGQKRRVEIISSVIRDSAGKVKTVAQLLDITAREQAEEELRLRAQILDGATDSILVHDLDENIVYVNEAVCRAHGYSREEFLKMKLRQIIVPEEVSGLSALRRELLGKGENTFETTHLRKDGSTVPMEVHNRTIESGERKLILAVMRDITERKQAEEALERQRAYFQQLFDNSPDAIAWLDAADKFVSVNRGFETLFGYRLEEVKGRFALGLIVSKDRAEEFLALSRAILAGKPVRKETVRQRKDGSLVDVSIIGYPIRFENKLVGRYIIYSDITKRKKAEAEEKRLQQELYLSRRLAAIGELAAGVAHEINNPLTGVLGFSQRLLRKSTSEAVSRDLEIIHDEAQRAANIVQNLLTFARRREPRKEYSSINDIMQKALELRSYALQTGNIEVTTNLAPSLPKVMVDFPQIQEVFLNIILNSEQAMNEAHGGGKLIIKTREIKDYVRISFADDGPGISPEQLDKVFDPFFTTREGKGGTGLGLSVCHGIVTGHGGKIYARSKPAKGGTTFFVELPLTPVETPVGRRF